ncbi:unnamed protein product [Mytilus coruscus]|uniref:Uncharacterized protein n=1 Tax=Mytilus coruscus TaxID=42192 RepID=A0A6J8BR70_MYTCO|nr:unnamed protein product [Mytilus coruscus]
MVYKFQEFGGCFSSNLRQNQTRFILDKLQFIFSSNIDTDKIDKIGTIVKLHGVEDRRCLVLALQGHQKEKLSNTKSEVVNYIIDKFTTSSSDCINILNKCGICVSKQTLERNQTMVVENKVNKPVDKIPSTLTIASIDNVNKRSSYAAVKSTDVHRGFDGTSVQLVEPKPQSISLNPDERLVVLPAVLNDSQFLEEKRFSQMTDYNIDEHVNHELYLYDLNRVVNYLDMTALVYVTGSAVNIFEEHDNSIKPIVQLRANPDSNHSINLLNKNGLYFPLISRQDYF